MTTLQTVYDAFLAKILDDEWTNWTEEMVQEDWRALLDAAIPQFMFPRKSLEHNGVSFAEDLSNEEIQILATYMKCEWLNRTILTWENVKPLYEERDFSQANMLDKLSNRLEAEQTKAEKLANKYYRTQNRKPFNWNQLAGK